MQETIKASSSLKSMLHGRGVTKRFKYPCFEHNINK